MTKLVLYVHLLCKISSCQPPKHKIVDCSHRCLIVKNRKAIILRWMSEASFARLRSPLENFTVVDWLTSSKRYLRTHSQVEATLQSCLVQKFLCRVVSYFKSNNDDRTLQLPIPFSWADPEFIRPIKPWRIIGIVLGRKENYDLTLRLG